ncbi:Uncharacterised protein [Serratia rubidaea]|uniref:Uncharacterized protein n=1 Tax=Serratia rubidaea TaxID=61652 RepID=A0A3S4JSC9_SERRU|nr:Uncharacterised protein [Serratia rubidaea]
MQIFNKSKKNPTEKRSRKPEDASSSHSEMKEPPRPIPFRHHYRS